jgi:hypothetical protein
VGLENGRLQKASFVDGLDLRGSQRENRGGGNGMQRAGGGREKGGRGKEDS